MNSWLEIDSFSLVNNVRVIRNQIGDLPIWANVSADAYSHDLAIASEAFWRGGVNGFVVTEYSDAKWLSEQRYKLPILILYPLEDSNLLFALEREWHLAITSKGYFQRIEHFARTHKKKANVHYEVDTGFHHTGMIPLEVEAILEKQLDTYSFLKPEGIFTQLGDAQDSSMSEQQIQIMQELQFSLQRKNIHVPMTHVLSSDGLGEYGDKYPFDAVRLGKALYGYSHYFPETRPALTWKTQIIALTTLKSGDTVGSAGVYKAPRTITAATLSVGYSDGLDRRLGNKGKVITRGKQCPIIGRIGKHTTTVDVSGLLKPPAEGEAVVILGQQEKESITLANIREWAGVLEDEFLSHVCRTIPRVKIR